MTKAWISNSLNIYIYVCVCVCVREAVAYKWPGHDVMMHYDEHSLLVQCSGDVITAHKYVRYLSTTQ